MAAKTKIVEMLTSMAGDGFSFAYGEKVTVPAKVAASWIEGGIAREVESDEAARARADGLEHTVKSQDAELTALRQRVADLEAENTTLKATAAPPAA